MLPYSVWVELLRGFFAGVTVEAFLQLCGNLAVPIMRLLPELSGTEPTAVSLESPQGRLQSTYPLASGPQVQILDALTQFFVRVSDRTPILLVLDDFQWCDQASLDLLQYLSGSGFRSHPFLTLCAFRDTSLDVENPRLQRFLSDLPSSEDLALTLHLDRFDSRGSAKLIQSAFGSGGVNNEICEVLFRKSGGNPFFLMEMLRLLAEKGAMTKRSDGQWHLAPNQVVDIPKSAKDIMRQRLASLDSEALDLLRIGAFVGEEFDLELLEKISRIDEKEPSLEKAVALGLIEERVVKGSSAYRFSDEVVMEVLVEKLGLERQRNYHLKVAAAMEEVYAKTKDEHASALALHYQMARNPHKCFEYSVRAGDNASRVSAHRDSSKHFATAIDSLHEIGEGEGDETRARLLERLGHEQ